MLMQLAVGPVFCSYNVNSEWCEWQ